MKLAVSISSTVATRHEGAAIALTGRNGFSSELYLDFSRLLRSVPQPCESALDFLLVASAVYAADKLFRRSDTPDKWTRSFVISVPVAQPRNWNSQTELIRECLQFLSGDRWVLHFTKRTTSLIRKRQLKRRSSVQPRYAAGKVACLFSGGLDSLVGAINWLQENHDERIALVGHHDSRIAGPLSDQKKLIEGLQGVYPGRFSQTLIGVGHTRRGPEITMRSRSLLFIALGVVVAEHLGIHTPLLIPENGTIALNVPLTASRRGSCSTRTAHPHYLTLLQQWLTSVGLNHPLVNPLLGKTKGEVVSSCKNAGLLARIVASSVSCAKRGRRNTWIRRHAKSCGRCMPCIYRRAALHAAGIDDEVYGVDMCKGEVDWTNPASEAADDFRACLSFLLRNPSQMDIAKMLMANGHLPPLEAVGHARTVQRAMDEIRKLLSDRGTAAVRSAAGLRGLIHRAN